VIFRTEQGNWTVRRDEPSKLWVGTHEDKPDTTLTHPTLLGVMDQIYAIHKQQQEKQQDGSSNSSLHA
jgi:hypothetical protein